MNWQLIVTIGVAVLNVFVSVLLALGLGMLKDMKAQINQRREETMEVKDDLVKRIETTQVDMRELRHQQHQQERDHAGAIKEVLELLPQVYVQKEDFIRTMASNGKQLDQVMAGINQLLRDFNTHVTREAQENA